MDLPLTGSLRRALWARLGRWVGFVASAAVVLSAALTAYSSVASLPTASLWVGDEKALKRLDPASNTFVQRISTAHNSHALGVDPINQSVWALIDNHLLKWNAAGVLLNKIDLSTFAAGAFDFKLLALGLYNGNLWVAGKNVWLYLTPDAQILAQGVTASDIQAIALDVRENLWVLTEQQLLRVTSQGTSDRSLALDRRLTGPALVAVDSIGGYLWAAGKDTLLRFDLADLNIGPLVATTPGLETIKAILTHPLEGTLWVASKNSLLIYDQSAALEKQTVLSDHDLGDLVQLAFEPRSASLWLAGKKAVARFTPEGDFVARLPAEQQIDALGVEPFELLPTVTILNPPDASLTNNSRPTLKLELGAECNGFPCELVDSFYAGIELDAKLNNQPVGSLFAHQNRVLSYQPATGLPEGANILTARVTDSFDHDSEEVTSRFTVDTIAPRFASLIPADGTTVSTAKVTIQGRLDDPTGSVTLQNASGVVLNLGGTSFSFAGTLQSGLNNFTLTATDQAGNTTTIPYRLIGNAPPETDSSPSARDANTAKGQPNTARTATGSAFSGIPSGGTLFGASSSVSRPTSKSLIGTPKTVSPLRAELMLPAESRGGAMVGHPEK